MLISTCFQFVAFSEKNGGFSRFRTPLTPSSLISLPSSFPKHICFAS